MNGPGMGYMRAGWGGETDSIGSRPVAGASSKGGRAAEVIFRVPKKTLDLAPGSSR